MNKSVRDYAKKIREHCEKTECEECDLYWKGYKICALHDNVTPDKWMLPGGGETFVEKLKNAKDAIVNRVAEMWRGQDGGNDNR